MESLILFYILLFATCFASAQKFTIAVTPSAQSVPIGQTATYSVAITPIDGFDATVFLSVSSPSFNGTSSFSTIIPSPPYVNVTLQITPNYLDTGSRTFIVTGKNGDVESTATFSLIVPKNVQWTSIKTPQQMGVDWVHRTLGKDNNGDVCFVNGDTKALYVNHYRNKEWETDTIVTFLDFTNFNISFVYDKTNILWFLTPQGIGRYDGKFTSILNNSNSNIVGDAISYIGLGRNGYPFCLSNSAIDKNQFAVEQFDGLKWTPRIIRKQEVSEKGWGGGFCIDSSDNIWLSTSYSSVRVQDTLQEAMYNFTENPYYQTVRKIICDKDGGIWYLYHYPIDVPSVKFEESLSYFDGKIWKDIPPIRADTRDFIIDENKKVWMVSLQGLHTFDGSEWVTYNDSNSSLPRDDNSVRGDASVIQDRNKNIWIMEQRQGVQFFVYNPFGLVNIPLPPTDVEELPVHTDSISLTPNPVSSVVTISGFEKVSSLRIMSSLGMEVKRFLVEGTKTNVDVSNFTSGMYFVQFNTQTGMISKAIMVSH